VAPTDSPRYRFGPLERRGIIGGLRKAQAVLLAVGLAVGVMALRVAPNGPNALLAFAALALAALVAFVPIQGRSLEEWTPVVARYLWRWLLGRDAYRSPAPGLGALARLPTDPDSPDSAAGLVELAEALPDELDTIEWASVPYNGRAVGVVKDTAQYSYAVALRCRVQAFGLLDTAQQARRLAGWGRVLSGLAAERSPIRRIGWVERTMPGDGDAIARYFSQARDDTVPLSSGAARSYIELIDSAGQVTQEHEIDLVLQADGQRLFRKAKKLIDEAEHRPRSRSQRRDALDQACGLLLVREAATLAGRLERAGVRVEGVLSPGMFPRAIKDHYDPYGRTHRARLDAHDPDRDGEAPANAGPIAAQEGWDHYRTDSALHTTYWIAQWPRIDVGPAFLQPLLMQTPILRSIAVAMEPIPRSKSIRDVEAAVTADVADEQLRADKGFTPTARRRQQARSTRQREEELVHGHAELRLAGFVTVSAPDQDGLERARAEIEHAAQQAHIELVPLYGQQAHAFTFTLPLARGLA
jgi:hypothetical protein